MTQTQTDNNQPMSLEPNKSTRDTLTEISNFLDRRFPVEQEEVEKLYQKPASKSADGEQNYYAAVKAENQKLHDAFARYTKAVSEPNPVFRYIKTHLKEGFTADEWTIFTAGLGFRVLPALAVLEMQDAFARAGNFHHSAIKDNLKDEAGIGTRSHIALYFDFIRAVRETFGKKIPLIDDMAIFGMTQQMLRVREDKPPTAEGPSSPDNGHGIFNAILMKTGSILPHHLRWSNLTTKKKVFPVDRSTVIEGLGPSHYVPTAKKWSQDIHDQALGANEVPWYNAAVKIAERLPKILVQYGDKTYQNQLSIMGDPSNFSAQLTNALLTLTRECNADKGSHIHASLLLMQRYLGNIIDKKYHATAMKWSSDHVGADGVEEDHAKAARQWFMTLADAMPWAAENVNQHTEIVDRYIKAFDFVVEKDYPTLQKAHMEAMVEAMQQARNRMGADNPLIEPKTNAVAPTAWRSFVGGVREVGEGVKTSAASRTGNW